MKFKIISTNIRFDNPADTIHAWDNRKSILSELLNNETPDIICSQEGRKPQLTGFESQLNGLKLIDSHREWIAERMYPCIFVNTKKFSVIESGDIWLSESPNTPGSKSFNSAFPRLCNWLKLQHLENEIPFFIINCHLDHCYTETRVEQIKVLLRETNKISNSLPVILCGDFNENPQGKVREILMQANKNLFDPWFQHNLKEETTFHKFKGKLKEGSRIDWIIADKRFTNHSIKIIKDHHDGIYPSDHFPVVASFSI